MSHLTHSLRTKDALKMMIVFGAFLVLGASAIVIRQNQSYIPPSNKESDILVQEPQTTAHSHIMYGVWEGNQTVIRMVNADGIGAQTLQTKLPFTIKNIHPMSADGMVVLYIAETDSQDHGKKIMMTDLTTGNSTTIIQAHDGRGIDSVVVSEDRRWIAYWEVALGSNGQLSGGTSAVYAASLASLPATPISVIQESAKVGSVVHYPLFFDHTGRLYLDGFSPNDKGWNQGLLQTTIHSPSLTPILSTNSYVSDPEISPSRDLIVYTSFDPSRGSLLPSSEKNPNAISILDLSTGFISNIPVETGRLYYDLTWSSDGTTIYARSYAVSNGHLSDARLVSIDVSTPLSPTVSEKNTDILPDGSLLAVGEDGIVLGTPGTETSAPGNLGSTYAPILSGFSVTNDTSVSTIPATNAQYITTLPGIVTSDGTEDASPSQQGLHLGAFNLKPELAGRAAQQNDPLPTITVQGRERCRDIYARLTGLTTSTASSIPTTFDPDTDPGQETNGQNPSLQLGQFGPGIQQTTTEIQKLPAFKDAKPMLREQYKCYDSPLYLYAPTNTHVSVRVEHAEILNSSLPYDKETGWSTTSTPEGTKIEYAFSAPFTPPQTGYVIPQEKVQAFLKTYAIAIGLVGKEQTDFISFWSETLPPAEVYQVSHFDNPEALMKITMNPAPETFMQTIMYFKPMTKQEAEGMGSLRPPAFSSSIHRSPTTAVDWSGIIDD